MMKKLFQSPVAFMQTHDKFTFKSTKLEQFRIKIFLYVETMQFGILKLSHVKLVNEETNSLESKKS